LVLVAAFVADAVKLGSVIKDLTAQFVGYYFFQLFLNFKADI